MHRSYRPLALMLVLAAGGCGAAPETVAVQGRVKIAGQSADNISVQFVPNSDGAELLLKAAGVTDGTGSFKLQCEDGRAGALPGRYHVLLEDLKVYANPRNDVPAQQRTGLIVSRIPKHYRAIGSTPLKATVGSNGQEIVLEVKP